MNIKGIKLSIINMIMYILYILVYVVILQFFGVGNSVANWRYYVLVLIIMIATTSIFYKNRNSFDIKKFHGKELIFSIITAIVFFVLSLTQAHKIGMSLNFRTYVQISLFLLPALYAINFINLFSMKTIFKLMKITTIIIIGAYFLEDKHTLLDFFNINNWLSINFKTFMGFTESSNYAETFLQLFLFFYYFKDQVKEPNLKKELNLFSIITFIFTMLSFKRLGMLFALVIVVYKHTVGRYISYHKNFKFKPALIFSILFTVLTIFYTMFMKGELFTDVDLYHFTSARNWILSLWANKGYLSYGYGSSMLIIGRYLEMDLVQIYLELNIVALFIFCYTFFRVAKKNLYANLIMLYVFMNMLTASSLPHQISWVVMLIVVSLIASDKFKQEYEIKKNIKKQKVVN